MLRSDTINKILLLSLIFVFMFVQATMAGITGKIAGMVFDKETKSPLQLANVVILYKIVNGVEVELPAIRGGATDAKGNFFILHVHPGRYVMRCNYMGYKEIIVRDVRVSVDKTTTVNFDLETAVIEGETVYVSAERDIISKDISATQVVTNSEDIQILPVENVGQIISMTTPGVMGGSFRGGSGRVQYFVDGINLNFDETFGGSFNNLNMLGISEMQVLLGGFNAEYGNVQDGVVNIIRKRPTKRLSIALDAKYAPAQYRHFQGDIFDHDMIFYQTYDNLETWADYPDPQAMLDLFREQTAPFNYTHPEDHINAFISGPIPFLNFLGFTLGVSHHYTPGVLPSSREKEYYGSENLTLEPTLRISLGRDMNLTLGGIYNHNKSQLIAWAIPPWELYYTAWFPLRDTFRRQFYLKWNHLIGAKTFYEIRAAYLDYRLSDKLHEDFVYPWTRTAPPVFQILGGDWYNISDNKTKTIDISGDVTSQLTSIHQFKAGAGVKFFKLDNNHINVSTGQSSVTGTGEVNPREGYAYMQDKIETMGIIVNIGLRMDWFDPNGNVYTNTWEPIALDGSTPATKKADAQIIFGPRLGMSYPVTENSIIYLNYGHFAERTALNAYFGKDYLYGTISLKEGPNYADWRSVNWIGNPDLEYQKTTAYEVGVRTRFAATLFADVSGYYKNIADQFRNFTFSNPTIGYAYNTAGNGSYADVRGLQIRLVKERSGFWGFNMGYTYQLATEGMNTPQTITPDNQIYPRANDAPRGFDITHSVFANVLLFVPPKTGPSLMGFYPFGGINIDFLFNARSGTPFTYKPSSQTEVNNYRFPAVANANLLVEKDLFFGLVAYCQINNLFNRKQRTLIPFRGLADQETWVDTGQGEFRFGNYFGYPAYYQFGCPRIFHIGFRFRY